MIYDEDNDMFLIKTFVSWVLNTAEARWSPIGDAPELSEEEQKLIYMSGTTYRCLG